jgi:ATP-dependent DNA helicase RecQ
MTASKSLPSASMITPDLALSRWFPALGGFRHPQREVVERLIRKQPTLLLMPTGGGKSLAYQLPALMSDGIAVVVSPLIALMREQAERLRGMGIPALSLGGVDPREAQEELRSFPFGGGAGFVFTSPERAETDGYLEHLLRTNRKHVRLVAIDEAHCISQWGYDFRPAYKAVPTFMDRAFGHDGWPPVLCMTATLDELSEVEVLQDFRMNADDAVRSHRMVRDNLELAIDVYADTKEKLAALDQLLEEHRGEKVIIYAHLKQNKTAGTRALAKRLCGSRHQAAAFDADLSLEEKDRVVYGFTDGSIRVVCATGAFGMGIDIPDIRGVIHFLLPESLEQYYQEVGRAGRDGAPAFGRLLYTGRNAAVREDMIVHSRIAIDEVKSVWNDLFGAGRAQIRSLSPNAEFKDREREYALFYAFQRVGAVELLARGPGRLESFKPSGPEGLAFLNRLSSATRIGNFASAIRKLREEPAAVYAKLFELYDNNEVKLTRSPDNVLIFRTIDLSDEQAAAIADDMNRHVERRLGDFLGFKAVVESGADIQAALKARFEVPSNFASP